MSWYYSPKVRRLLKEIAAGTSWGVCIRHNNAFLELLYDRPENYKHTTLDCTGFFGEKHAIISGNIRCKTEYRRFIVPKQDLKTCKADSVHSVNLAPDIPRPGRDLNAMQAYRALTKEKGLNLPRKNYTFQFNEINEYIPLPAGVLLLTNFKEAVRSANKRLSTDPLTPFCHTPCIFVELDEHICEVYTQVISGVHVPELIVPYEGTLVHDLLADLAARNSQNSQND